MSAKRYQDEFYDFIESRGIDRIVHVGLLPNLESILRHGIVPRTQIEASDVIHALDTGDFRGDQNLDAICCSVQQPNVYILKKRQRETKQETLVFGLSVDVLVHKNCLFYPKSPWTNFYKNKPRSELSHLGAFKKLFHGRFGDRSQLAPSMPSNSGAEVHVLETIEPEYIDAILVQTTERLAQLRDQFPEWATRFFYSP